MCDLVCLNSIIMQIYIQYEYKTTPLNIFNNIRAKLPNKIVPNYRKVLIEGLWRACGYSEDSQTPRVIIVAADYFQ